LEEVKPKLEVANFVASDCDLLVLVPSVFYSEADAVQEVTRERDHISCVVEAADCGLQFSEARFAHLDYEAKVFGPSFELVMRQEDGEASCVQVPTKDDLDLGWGSYSN
jgi:hypothetical protein